VWGLGGFFATLAIAGIGFGVTGVQGQVTLAHYLFAAAFPCGLIALRAIVIHYVQRRSVRAIFLLAVVFLLGIGLWKVDATFAKLPDPAFVIMQMLPGVSPSATTSEFTTARIEFCNQTDHEITERMKIMRFPPIRSVGPGIDPLHRSGKVAVISGDREGSTFLQFRVIKLSPGEAVTFLVNFLKPEPILSWNEWLSHYDYAGDKEVYAFTLYVGEFKSVK
jgi:hypothetical protein